MQNYLGEFPVELSATPFADYTTSDWAMYIVARYGQIDGEHHKQWVLDQVARILKGSPVIVTERRWKGGMAEYSVDVGQPSPEYFAWVEERLGGVDEDGEREYAYDEGIAP